MRSGSEAEASIFVFELRHTTAGIHQARAAAVPRRMRGRVDVERHGRTFVAPSGARLVLGPVGHFDGDHVVVGMGFGFHSPAPYALAL